MSRQRIAGTAHRWLLLVPFVWQAGLAPFIDDVALRPFSLPFSMFWQMAGIVLTTIVIAVVLRLDRRREAAAPATSPPPASSSQPHETSAQALETSAQTRETSSPGTQ